MKHLFFLSVLLAAAATALGQQPDTLDNGVPEAVSNPWAMLGVTWDSKYVWRGFEVFDDKSAVHFLGDVSLFDTGFGLSVAGHRANSSGFEKLERWDYTAYYQNGLFPEDSPYATNFRLGFVYYNYPQRNRSQSLDLEEGHLILAWPNILPVQGLQPSYVLVKTWPVRDDGQLPDAASGWLHIFMLDYAFTVPGITPEIYQQTVRLHSELVYNDGWSPTPEFPNPGHEFSHAVFGASTDFAFGKTNNLIFTPALYYQLTMDHAINDDDELWASLALKFLF